MILLNEEQRLGRKAYILMALKNLVAPLIISVIAIVFLVASRGIGDLIFLVFKLAGSGTQATSGAIAYGLNYASFLVCALALVSIVMGFITTKFNYRNYTFTFEEFGLRLKHGRFRMTELTIPYRQIQDIDIERGFLHQLTGTSRVIINSAGHQEAATKFNPEEETNIVLDPLDKTAAEEVRIMLQRKIGVQVVEGEREADREALEQSAPQPTPPHISQI
ncbi:MAG TPA: PH domain-containing protein [Candidatus Paceibacterota bacterium]